ncbi:breast cancer type 1 susceptibility protein homolog isoform X2 [Protopterus annectens]|uniref:breast cancer type 1 susceptibility protein homolog isoform X2 n=1 Tax=Protopterus annectens TaxID=7888 RepID=UPI001CFADCD7|nr:breast cancer type 1 susceptibility protein homolog isoform X2 [Protopterus annectens]
MALSHCRIEEVRHILSLMHKNLECPICLELMKEPVSTKCDHQFCRYCMLKLLGKKRRGIGQCPLCKLEVTKRSLRESSRFKLLVEGVQKAIRAFELDTGIESGASCLPKTSVKPTFNENLHNDIDVVQSKGYTSRQKNVTSKAGSEHCTVECHISARLTEPVVAKHSEQNREKTVEPVGSVFIEFGSDESSDEQLFKWKPDDR